MVQSDTKYGSSLQKIGSATRVASTPSVRNPTSSPNCRLVAARERKLSDSPLMAAWRMRQSWKGRPSDRSTGQHIARFILTSLYTGSAAVCGAVRPMQGRALSISAAAFFSPRRRLNRDEGAPAACRLPDRPADTHPLTFREASLSGRVFKRSV